MLFSLSCKASLRCGEIQSWLVSNASSSRDCGIGEGLGLACGKVEKTSDSLLLDNASALEFAAPAMWRAETASEVSCVEEQALHQGALGACPDTSLC